MRNYLKVMYVGRELPFDKLRANVFFSEFMSGEYSSKRILRWFLYGQRSLLPS